MELLIFTDSDYAGENDGRRSTTGVMAMLGQICVACISRTQKSVALSSCEAELMALTEGAREAIYLRRLLRESGLINVTRPTAIAGDNQGSLALAKNPIFHDRSKHIATRWYYVRQQMQLKEIEGIYVHTKSQLADLATKGSLSSKQFKALTMMVCGYAKFQVDSQREKVYHLCSN